MNATIRQGYVKCGNPDFQKPHDKSNYGKINQDFFMEKSDYGMLQC
jgi:hypothetical protein